MPKKIKSDDWWFKFEIPAWRNSPELRRCSLETRGFWIDCIAIMRDSGSAIIKGTVEDIARSVGCFPQEATRCIDELKRHKTADVTQINGNVTLKSRKYAKELKAKEQSRLRVRKFRSNADVTQELRDKEKSNKKEVISKKEEEGFKRVNTPAEDSQHATVVRTSDPTPAETDYFQTITDGLCARLSVTQLRDQGEWYNTLLFAYQNQFSTDHVLEVFDLLRQQKWRKGRVTGKNVGDNLTEIVNLREEIEQQRQNNGKPQQNTRQTASERNLERHIANRTLAERIVSGELNEAIDAIHGGVVDHHREDPEPRKLTSAD